MSKITVKIAVVEDEDGTELIIPSERELDDQDKAIREQIADIRQTFERTSPLLDEKEREKERVQTDLLCERMEKTQREFREHCANLRPKARVDTYVLKTVSYRDWMQAEGAAKTLNTETGDVTVDRAILMEELFPHHVEGKTPEEVGEIDIKISTILWDKLYASCFPGTSRLPFLSCRQSRS